MEITPEIAAIIKEKLDAQKTELTATFEESVAGLKKSQQDLLVEKKTAEEESERIKMAKAAKDKDVTTLSESYEIKLQQERNALQEIKNENTKLMDGIKQAEIGKISNSFVSENVIDDQFIREAMNSAYSKRVDIRSGKTVILDPEGNLTALTLEDLNKEFKTANKYANHIRVSKSTGGGATGSRKTGGASVIANINGNTAEKASALAGEIPSMADLPVR